ncbi:hypothetical protein MRB53_035156 [Persea americana]|uniref:Uncharacterized protein n=1 Tax=Persea americana TaxID=3435 RepID=A0ACC2K3W9_PERAE|nr:hypothetical protein MRB53_035156 [Persea americana]
MWGQPNPKNRSLPAIFFLSGSCAGVQQHSNASSAVLAIFFSGETRSPLLLSSPVTARSNDKDRSSFSPPVDQLVFFSGRSNSPIAALWFLHDDESSRNLDLFLHDDESSSAAIRTSFFFVLF